MSEKDRDTENKIKEAARAIFHEKGFAATRTRDIAEAADINLALLNYYFRSKQKLFDLIMLESIQSFFEGVVTVLNNESTTLKEKVEDFVAHYIDFLTENPNMPSFILNAIRENPDEYINKLGVHDKAKESVFFKQFEEGMSKGEIPAINPIHFMLNVMGLVVFPFIAQPMISTATGIPKDLYYTIIQERKKLIPLWIQAMLTVK